MGKHAADPSPRRRSGAVVLLTAAVLAVGAGVAAAALAGGDETSASETSGGSGGSGGAVSASAASAGGGLAGHDACVAEVAAQDRLAKAVAGSAKHWRTHVDAQLRLDEGVQDGAATQAQWASSKLEGPGDVKAYDEAMEAVNETSGDCYQAAQGEDSEDSSATDDCLTRLDGLKRVTRAGGAVHGEWSAHLRMMKNKAHTEGALYHDRWLGMVERAEPTLKTYDSAVEEIEQAPACA